jgi:hypothetical protein
MATDGGTEWTRKRAMPEAAYCVPDERNRRLVFAGQCAAQIVWLRDHADLTPEARMAAMAAYAKRIREVVDLLRWFE